MVLWLPHSRSFQGEPASLRARCWRLPRRPTIRLDNSDANDSRRDDLGHRGRGVTTEGSLGGASPNRRLTSVVPLGTLQRVATPLRSDLLSMP
jgi:hypothetical protein